MGYKGIKVNLQLLQGSRNVIVIVCKKCTLRKSPHFWILDSKHWIPDSLLVELGL